MTKEEATKFFDEQKANGMSEDEILAVLYKMFQDDKIDLNQLEALCAVMGYELTEEFKNMSDEDKKTKGVEQAAEDEDVAEEIDEGIAAEEKGEDEDEDTDTELKEDSFDSDEEDDDEVEEEESETTEEKSADGEEKEEEDEEKKARKLFGLD